MDGKRQQSTEVDWKGCSERAGNYGKGRGTQTPDLCKYQDGERDDGGTVHRRIGMNEKFFALPVERQGQIINAAYN